MTSAHIIIVNYNSGDWLARSVASALAQSQAQVTVVDNASQDDSVEIAKRAHQAPRLEWLINDQNKGFAAANNQILREIEADYAILMNPDCELRENTVEKILLVMESDSSIGMASCRILNEDGSLQATCRRRFPTPWSALVRMLFLDKLFPNNPRFANFDYGDQIDADDAVETVDAISGAFMVVRRAALEQVGVLDEDYFMHCEDLDWCKRFQLAGWRVVFVPSASVLHAKGISSKSRPVRVLYTLHTGMNRFFDKFYTDTYSLPLRLLVKLGIVISFLARAAVAVIKR